MCLRGVGTVRTLVLNDMVVHARMAETNLLAHCSLVVEEALAHPFYCMVVRVWPPYVLAPFSETEPGISSIETLLPLTLRLVDDALLTSIEAIARLTHHPAEILGLDKGHLAEGAIADICIFDPEKHWTVEAQNLVSQGKNTPLNGWDLKGRVTHTLLNGEIVFSLNA